MIGRTVRSGMRPQAPGPAGTPPPGSLRGKRPLAGKKGSGGKGARREEGAVRPPLPIWMVPSAPRTGGRGGAALGRGPPRRPRARARQMRVERRPPVSGALLSHGLTPQYHRRSAA